MRTLLFTHKINGDSELTGLVDVSKTPPEPFCFCDKETAELILHWQERSEVLSDIHGMGDKPVPEKEPTYTFSLETEKHFEEHRRHNASLQTEADDLGLIYPEGKRLTNAEGEIHLEKVYGPAIFKKYPVGKIFPTPEGCVSKQIEAEEAAGNIKPFDPTKGEPSDFNDLTEPTL
jgi:hypothetical protein